jgi:peptidoglycan/LPS O-acetylase OafA/YrhL
MDSDRPAYRHDIEGLRGIAILLVIAFHAGVSSLAGGFVGVDVFFVLSGYFITGLLAREALTTGDVDLASFYARRARRLLPAFFVVLIATLGIALWLYAPIDAPRIASDGRAVALHYGNVLFAQKAVNYHAGSANPLLHTWSLAVEEQFYFVWPFLFAFIGRMRPGEPDDRATRRRLVVAVFVAGAASLVASFFVTRFSQPWAFFGMPTRIWEFAAGGLVALVMPANVTASPKVGTALQVAGLGALGYAAIVYHEAMPYPGTLALVPALATVALIVGGAYARDGLVTHVLSARILAWFGRISYSWYLWHWPLVGLGVVLDWQIGAVGKLVWSAIALGLAVLTHRYVEEPLRHTDRFADSARRLNMFAIGATVGMAMLAWAALGLAVRRASSPEQRRIAAARVDGMPHECWGSLVENAKAPCIFGDVDAATSVVLMGDSHAEHWLPAMDRIGKERHWKVYAMVKPACPVADVPSLMNQRLKRFYTECAEWRRAKLARIVALRPSFVVLSSYDHYLGLEGKISAWNVTPSIWRDGLRRTYSLLASAEIRTIVLRDVPDVGFDVPACLSRQASGAPMRLRSCQYDLAASLHPDGVRAQNDAARGLSNVAFVDMNDRLCQRGTACPVIVRGSIVYKDDDHITASFSRAEGPVLGSRIAAAADKLGR